MGRIRIEFLVPNGKWFSKYVIDKNTNFNATSQGWTLLNLDFTETNYGIKLVFDQLDTALAVLCFSNVVITHPVYEMDHIIFLKDFFRNQFQNIERLCC